MVRNAPFDKRAKVQAAWQKIKPAVERGAGWYSGVQDVNTLTLLVADLGAFTSRVEVRHYGGKPHIILKGYAGRRAVLDGTRYLTTNTKVITMGLGRAAAQHAAWSGGVLTIYLMTGYRVLDYFLSDAATLTQLLGSLATDVAKVGVAVAASWGAEAGIVAVWPAVATFAIGPLVAVLVVGSIVSISLDFLDKQYDFTGKLIRELEALEERIDQEMGSGREAAVRALGDVVRGHTKKLVLVPR